MLFVLPIFNLQRYGPGEAFHAWHCDWTTSEEATELIHRGRVSHQHAKTIATGWIIAGRLDDYVTRLAMG